jgi:hypothetical protein
VDELAAGACSALELMYVANLGDATRDAANVGETAAAAGSAEALRAAA